VLAAPIAVLGTAFHEIEDPQFQLSGPAIFFWVLLAAAWPVGRAFRLRAEAVDTLSRRAEQLRERRDADARAAVAAERERIARELHDVVGHGLSVIVLQLVAADGMLDGGDAPAARQRLGAAERSARQSLAEMRRLLGLLDEQDASLTPQPGITDLPQLVEETRAAGVDVELEVAGRPVELSAGVELTAYRVVQEALTNVIKHARPPRARVRLTYAPGELTVEVVDDGAAVTGPRDSGRGIAGMRERVALYDGDLSVGPRAEGGFAVRAQLPVVE
jgi:signal transduction histidine kinase